MDGSLPELLRQVSDDFRQGVLNSTDKAAIKSKLLSGNPLSVRMGIMMLEERKQNHQNLKVMLEVPATRDRSSSGSKILAPLRPVTPGQVLRGITPSPCPPTMPDELPEDNVPVLLRQLSDLERKQAITSTEKLSLKKTLLTEVSPSERRGARHRIKQLADDASRATPLALDELKVPSRGSGPSAPSPLPVTFDRRGRIVLHFRLPQNVWYHIFDFLTVPELAGKVCRLSRGFHELCDQRIYQRLTCREFQQRGKTPPTECSDWKMLFLVTFAKWEQKQRTSSQFRIRVYARFRTGAAGLEVDPNWVIPSSRVGAGTPAPVAPKRPVKPSTASKKLAAAAAAARPATKANPNPRAGSEPVAPPPVPSVPSAATATATATADVPSLDSDEEDSKARARAEEKEGKETREGKAVGARTRPGTSSSTGSRRPSTSASTQQQQQADASQPEQPRLLGLQSDRVLTYIPSTGTRIFRLEGVYDGRVSQAQIYSRVASGVTCSVLMGYNGTLFVYGQTGSGKTYSMYGPSHFVKKQGKTIRQSAPVGSPHAGIVQRACAEMISSLNADPDTKWSIQVTFVEIYQENIFDLLEKGSQIILTGSKTFDLQGAQTREIKNVADVEKVIAEGDEQKHMFATQMNERSSRSHSVFTLHVTQSNRRVDSALSCRYNLVDLAGSERVNKSGATGQRFEEAKAINKSLSTLERCILNLSRNEKHIPYRDSVLTMLLQNALGGDSQTTMLITCSSALQHGQETMSTLRFGERTQTITNKASRSDLIGQVKTEVSDIKKSNSQIAARFTAAEMNHLRRVSELRRDIEREFTILRQRRETMPRIPVPRGRQGAAADEPPPRVVQLRVEMDALLRGFAPEQLDEYERFCRNNERMFMLQQELDSLRG